MVEIPDGTDLPAGHPPSPYDSPLLLVGQGTLPPELTIRAIGWLEQPGFETGKVADACVRTLMDATPGRLFSDGTRGIHSCELCGKTLFKIRWKRKVLDLRGYGHYLIRNGDIVYMTPSLLLHYIIDHKYRPPDEFLAAVTDGRFLTEDDLVITWKYK